MTNTIHHKLKKLNMKKKILIVFGTRPEAIKLAPLIVALRNQPLQFKLLICVTAQHRELLDQVLKVFEIKPNIDLNLMKQNQDLFEITANIQLQMKKILNKHKPDAVIVHGDTTTALSTSIAAFYAKVPVGHVEAGLRTNNLLSPFPEEFNRQVVSKIAKWHFAPTKTSRESLLSEKVPNKAIIVTGNTVIDSLKWVLNKIEKNTSLKTKLNTKLNNILPFNWTKEIFILITGHRRESFGKGLRLICNAIHDLALNYPKINFVYPVHLNPNVIEPVTKELSNLKNVHLVDPLDYEPFIYLLKHCHFVITDSGGIQEEAPSIGKPVLVTREVTERPEAVSAGTVLIVGTNKERIVSEVSRLIDDKAHYIKMSKSHNPYGDGNSSKMIMDILRAI